MVPKYAYLIEKFSYMEFRCFTYVLLKFRLEIVHDGHAKDLVQSQETEKDDKESFHLEALV